MAEGNQIKWFGIRPVSPVENIPVSMGVFETVVAGITRTQIIKSGDANNETLVIHTVTAGKTFYFVCCGCGVDSGADKYAHVLLRNAADATIATIIDIHTTAQTAINRTVSFPIPIVLAAGFDVAVVTDNPHASVFVLGWEQ